MAAWQTTKNLLPKSVLGFKSGQFWHQSLQYKRQGIGVFLFAPSVAEVLLVAARECAAGRALSGTAGNLRPLNRKRLFPSHVAVAARRCCGGGSAQRPAASDSAGSLITRDAGDGGRQLAGFLRASRWGLVQASCKADMGQWAEIVTISR